MQIEDIKNANLYRFWTGVIKTGLEWKKCIALNPQAQIASNLELHRAFKSESSSELDVFTEIKLRKEWKDLINHIGNDPLLDPWIMDLAVNRCKEIQKLLLEIK